MKIFTFAGNLGDGVKRTYVTGVSYDEAGRMTEEKYGTLTPLYHKQHFNVRGQLYDIRLSTVPWATDDWNWNRGAVLNYYDGSLTARNFNSGTDNNGNVLRSEAYAPADDQINSYSYTQQNYTYDELNRLTSVVEKPGTNAGLGTASLAQAYVYDRWGNRTIDQNTSKTFGYQVNALQSTVDTSSNRMYAVNDASHSLMDYDAAGNQNKDYLTGNGLRTFDGENRMVTATTGTSSNSYTYDGDGRRVRRNVAGAETWQMYGMDGELLAEYAAGAATFLPQKEYGYRSGQLLVTATNGDEQRLTRYVQNLYWRTWGYQPSASELQTKVNALAAAGNLGSSQMLTEAQSQARALFSTLR